MSDEKVIKNHTFTFNQDANGGEQVELVTKFLDNGDDGKEGIIIQQELIMQSYSNAVTLHLCGAVLTPELLRRLADELVEAECEAIHTKIDSGITKKKKHA